MRFDDAFVFCCVLFVLLSTFVSLSFSPIIHFVLSAAVCRLVSSALMVLFVEQVMNAVSALDRTTQMIITPVVCSFSSVAQLFLVVGGWLNLLPPIAELHGGSFLDLTFLSSSVDG